MQITANGSRPEHINNSKDVASPALREQQILADQIRLLYEQQPLGLFATVVNACLTGYVLWHEVSSAPLLLWLAAIGLVTAGRYAMLRVYRRTDPVPQEARRWGQRFVTGAALGGAMWGIAGGLLTPVDSYLHLAFMALVLAGMTAGALSSMASYQVASLTFLGTTLGPFALRLLSHGGGVFTTMGCMVLLYAVMAYLISRRHQIAIRESLRLRYDKLDLVDDLTVAKLQQESLNNDLTEEIQERQKTEAALQVSNEFYRSLVETSGTGYHILDEQGQVLDANPIYVALTGHRSLEDIVGRSVIEWTASHDQHRNADEVRKCLENGSVRNLEIDYLRPGGGFIPIEINATVVRGEAGTRILALSRDISERKQAERILQKAHGELELKVQARTEELARANIVLEREKEIFRVTLASIGDAVITTDAEARVTYLNRVAEQLTGWHTEEARGLAIEYVLRSPDRQVLSDSNVIARCLETGEVLEAGNVTRLLRRDGDSINVDLSVAPIRDGDRILGVVVTFRDVTEQHELARQLTHQATHDQLTGLVNRFEFEQRLSHCLGSASAHSPHAVLYMDLDQFKVVNDTCGHGAGDDLLRQLAALLQSKLRSRDTLARLGGDEFGVLLEHCPMQEALRIASSLRDLVHGFRFSWSGKPFSLGVSIGLVSLEEPGGSLASILSAADSACYAAKDKGRNRVHVYQTDDATVAQRDGQMRWLPRIQDALAEDRFRLYQQPIVPVADGGNDGAYNEILLRMLDEQGNLLPPGAFLAAAERYDQMLAIDRWVVAKSLATIAQNRHRDGGASYSINLSGRSVGQEGFLAFVIEQFDASRIPPSGICFEITETAAISDLSHVLHFIDKLKQRGCRFALDDFGAGLSSFGYLKNLPVDYLKIDGSFIRDLPRNPADQAMVEAIHRIGHVMGLKTIAEWVEDDVILERLRIIGVDYAQGYVLGKPEPFTLQ